MTIITTRSRSGVLTGMTANSFTSVSLTPPLVLWSSSLYANSLPAFQESSHFVVNILALRPDRAVEPLCEVDRGQVRRCRSHRPGIRRAVLIGSAAHFECRNEFRHYGGDHIIFIGHVERFAYTDKPTLMFCRGKYMRGEPIMQN